MSFRPLALSALLGWTIAGCSTGLDLSDPTFNTSQEDQTWAFVTVDGTKQEVHAKVVMKGCTQSQCNGATFESVRPYEWTTPFGTCNLHWHISGQVTGDLVSFTLNGSECETTIQGRSGTGGTLNGKFGTATGTTGQNAMSWNGFSTLFSSSGTPQAFNGSGYWVAFRCGFGSVACNFQAR